MFRRTLPIAVVAAVFLLLASCGGKKEEQPTPVKRAPQPVKEAAPAGDSAAERPVMTDLSADGKHRNPFLSHLVLLKGKPAAGEKIRGPLERFDVSLFRLIAVVSGGETPAALVVAPDNKRYIIKRGDPIGIKDGKVIGIDDRSVVVREYNKDEDGKVVSSYDVEIKLPGERDS